jgi:hypothetical protein
MSRTFDPVGFTWDTAMPGLVHGTSRHGYTAILERHATSDWSADVYFDPDPVGHATALPTRHAAEQAARDIATRDHNPRGPFQ